MSTTITTGLDVMTPTVIDGYESTRRSSNIMHPILGSENVDVTYRPAKLRSGTLRMVFSSEADALEAEFLHANGTVFTIASTDRTAIVMSYAVDGDITLRLDDETRAVWLLDVGYQEVSA